MVKHEKSKILIENLEKFWYIMPSFNYYVISYVSIYTRQDL